MQNAATACAIIFHKRQTQFRELHVFDIFWTDISIFPDIQLCFTNGYAMAVGTKPYVPSCWRVDASTTWALWIPLITDLGPRNEDSEAFPKSWFWVHKIVFAGSIKFVFTGGLPPSRPPAKRTFLFYFLFFILSHLLSKNAQKIQKEKNDMILNSMIFI